MGIPVKDGRKRPGGKEPFSMNVTELIKKIDNGGYDGRFAALYGDGCVPAQRQRYGEAAREFLSLYGDLEASLFSVSGRSEISGNHTDHNRGCVLAASIDLDVIAVAAKTDDGVISVKSKGFPEDTVTLSAASPCPEDHFTSRAIIGGVAAGFSARGRAVGGFRAYTTSNVFKGSGLSSSAAFEDMIGNILSHFYNDGKVSSTEIAIVSKYAENEWFGKPCGLMDQIACANGGFVYIDFKDKEPVIDPLPFDLTAAGYVLCIVNTGGNHADLNADYAAVPGEMKAVAAYFGAPDLSRVTEEDLYKNIAALREKTGDRAILRAHHFFSENRRVKAQRAALASGDVDKFLRLVKESGDSSFKYLQNVYTTQNVAEQGLSLALSLSERYLEKAGGVCRVHGGGFAGTIQAFVPAAAAAGYRDTMNGVFGDGACVILHIRAEGAVKL